MHGRSGNVTNGARIADAGRIANDLINCQPVALPVRDTVAGGHGFTQRESVRCTDGKPGWRRKPAMVTSR